MCGACNEAKRRFFPRKPERQSSGMIRARRGHSTVPTSRNVNGFAVMPDGEHFLMVRAEPEAIPSKIHFIFNWFEEIKRLVPVGK